MSETRILVAGIGDILLGDDGVGVEVVRQLGQRLQLPGVRIADYGIRGFDLMYGLLGDHEAVVLVDAMPRGGAPGTVCVIEVEPSGEGHRVAGRKPATVKGHDMNPEAVLDLVRAMGGRPCPIYVVGCEPATLGPENEGPMGLSPEVEAAVPEMVAAVEMLVHGLLAAPAPAAAVPAGERHSSTGPLLGEPRWQI